MTTVEERLSSSRAKVEECDVGDEKLQGLQQELKAMEENEEMNAKQRRALKRLIDLCSKKINGESSEDATENIVAVTDAPYIQHAKLASDKLRAAQTQQEVTRLLNFIDIVAIKADDETSSLQELKATLKFLISPEQMLSNPLNLTLRRRINRFIFALSSDKEKTAIQEDEKDEKNKKTKAKAKAKENASDVPSKPAPVSQQSSSLHASNLFFENSLKLLDCSEDPDEIEICINEINAHVTDSQGDISITLKPKMAEAINSILESDKRSGPSRLRRKLRRLHAIVSIDGDNGEMTSMSCHKSSSSSSSSSSKTKSISADDFQNKSVSQCLEQLSKAVASTEVEEAIRYVSVKSIYADDVSEKERSGLKELISSMLRGDHQSNITLQSSQRRKLKRLVDNLGGDSQEVIGELKGNKTDDNIPENVKRARITSNNSEIYQRDNENVDKYLHQPNRSIPYVVFVGQLAFSTTKEQIESHFRNEGNVDGDIRVRVLTNKDNNRSKGMAFVQVEGSRELRRCLDMHQSFLDGRIINVEQSTGKKGKGGKGGSNGDKEEDNRNKVAARSKTMFAPPPLRPAV